MTTSSAQHIQAGEAAYKRSETDKKYIQEFQENRLTHSKELGGSAHYGSNVFLQYVSYVYFVFFLFCQTLIPLPHVIREDKG